MNGIGPFIEQVELLPENPHFGRIRVEGKFVAECIRPDGSTRWRDEFVNGVTNVGFNLMLDSTFRAASISPISTWYIGLISNSGYSGLNATDTMASHAGWTEDSTHFSESVRQTWTKGAAASKSITNSSSANFSITTDSTVIKGIFVTSDSTLAGTSGTLWSNGLFSADQTLFNGDTLKITYTVSLS